MGSECHSFSKIPPLRGSPLGVKGGGLASADANPAFGPAERTKGAVVLPESSRLLGACYRMLGDCSDFFEKMLQDLGCLASNF